MATQLVNPKPTAEAKLAAGVVADLVRLLVRQAADSQTGEAPAVQAADDKSEEIILDVDLDGTRYLLVRLPKAEPARVQLSPREQEIVRMVAQGHSNKIIAGVLSISSWTVCTHLRRIFAKLGVTSRAAMIARLLENSSVIRNNPASVNAVRR